MDTAVPVTSPTQPALQPAADTAPYNWTNARPTQAMDGGPQVSQPAGELSALPAGDETPRAATARRAATVAAGVGLVAVAVLTARSLRGAKTNLR